MIILSVPENFKFETDGWRLYTGPYSRYYSAEGKPARYVLTAENQVTRHQPVFDFSDESIHFLAADLTKKGVFKAAATVHQFMSELRKYGPVVESYERPTVKLYQPADYFDDRNRFIPKRLGDLVLAEKRIITFRDTHESWLYVDGVYVLAESFVREKVKECLGDRYLSRWYSETMHYVQSSTYVDREVVTPPANLIILQNGVLNVQTRELSAFDPKWFFTSKLPLHYDVLAFCPKIDAFLKDVLQPSDVENIYELFAYCLWRDYPIHKSFMFLGSGSNGKSTLINVIKSFLGHENVSNVALQDLEQRFSKARLYGKLANCYPDLPSRALKQTGTFKMVTGNDPLEAEQKFKDAFPFQNHAKMVFSCNTLPETGDETEAFWRRWMLVPFSKKFEGKSDNPNLIKELTTREELSGLLNEALKRLPVFLERGNFVNAQSSEAVRAEYMRKSSPVQAFIMDCVVEDAQAEVEVELVYQRFVAYCLANKLPSMLKEVFGKKLISSLPIRKERHGSDKNRAYVYVGIRLVDQQSAAEPVQSVLGGGVE